jgi:SAM-dependent methyltransferase
MLKRPWRTAFFAAFEAAIKEGTVPVRRLLELGSGPGFLAEHLLANLPPISYVALDFSSAMHQLAAERLGPLAQHVLFVERSFRETSWGHGLGKFEVIVTHQAVHELRHKRHASTLHAQVKSLLVPGGVYLVCDHYAGEDGMCDSELYMTVAEHYEALKSAGFNSIDQLLLKGGLALHRAS